ncbi:AMP-binding protein [Streptomyces mirabilis]|uniref:AMP-binding protein n=1 Tax=Streptomyces mirabilis TaxID=68239 RepID=UPI00366371B8
MTTNVARLAADVGVPLDELRDWSVSQPDEFWASVSRLYGPRWSTPYERVRGTDPTGPESWFPGGRTNIAAWALSESHPETLPALRWLSEDGAAVRLTRAELRAAAAEIGHRLRGLGIGPGSRVGLVAAPHWCGSAAVLGILAAGASCLPLFSGYGAGALRDRVEAGAPDLILVQGTTRRKGAEHDIAAPVRAAVGTLPRLGVITLNTQGTTRPGDPVAWDVDELITSRAPWAPAALPSGAPAIVLFTSGSTGLPKGVVLSHAGYAHQLASEWRLHLDLREGDRVLWPADPGWVVGSFTLLGALAGGAELTLLDGNPAATITRHTDFSDVTIIGGSPSFLASVAQGPEAYGLRPRIIAAAGEPFSSEAWAAVERSLSGNRPLIINLCGGTEVGTCLLATLPYDDPPKTGFGGPALGVDADVVDDLGRSVSDSLGVLVARNSWPGRAIEVFNTPDGIDGYFRRFGGGVWSQEDLALRTSTGWFVKGRADEVLKIAGRRVGPSEIEDVALATAGTSACVAVDATVDGHSVLIVVVESAPGADTDVLAQQVSAAIEGDMGRPFRPFWTGAGPNLPRTTTGKLDRRTVRNEVRASIASAKGTTATQALRAWMDTTTLTTTLPSSAARHPRRTTMNTIDWDRVQRGLERENHRMIWRPYGLPTVSDPNRSSFFEGEVSPRWDVPRQMAVSVAITGAFFQHEQNPNQPITPREIYEEARAVAAAGASTVHIHVRDDKGYNTLSADRFREVIVPLKEEFPNLAVDGCLVAALDGEWEQMKEVLATGLLDAVPLNTAATYVGDALFAKPIPVILEKARLILESGAKPIIACYTDGDISNADRLLFKSGLMHSGSYWCLLPALPGCSPMATPRQAFEGLLRLSSLIREIDPEATILVCAAGRASTYLVTAAAALGLHVRVGMEDTVWTWPHRDDLVQSNLQMFQMAKDLAGLLGRDIPDHAEYRSLVGLAPASVPAKG